MKLKIDFEIPESTWKINPEDKIVSFGSCFSDEIGERLKNDGFNTEINPFGVLFHPLAIATVLRKIIQKDTATTCIKKHDVVFSWDTSGLFFAYNEEDLFAKFSSEIERLNVYLKQANVLLLTFGTAYGYRLKTNNHLVANCHKQPGDDFVKELTSLEEMYQAWNSLLLDLKQFNPKLKIVFTLSPVKHLRDGIVENVRSKARLIELVSRLDAAYFPSFEIVQEELRDYRFFKEDGAHPNELAINYIYSCFVQKYFSSEALIFREEVTKYNAMKNHRLLYEKSQQSILFVARKEAFLKELKTKYPFINIEP